MEKTVRNCLIQATFQKYQANFLSAETNEKTASKIKLPSRSKMCVQKVESDFVPNNVCMPS